VILKEFIVILLKEKLLHLVLKSGGIEGGVVLKERGVTEFHNII